MADREKSVAQIVENVLGAMMFGVPSLGMEQSHLMAMVEGRPNELLVQDLARDGGAKYVRQLNTRFEGLTFLRRSRVVWAYETMESPTLLKRQDGSWERSGLPAVSRGDSDLTIVIDTIGSICSIQQSRSKATTSLSDQERGPTRGGNLNDGSPAASVGKDELILKEVGNLLGSLAKLHGSLYLSDLDFRSQIDTPFQDTFHWLFDLPMFSKWLQEGSGLFWIRGKPGSGKSTLMKYICQSRQTRDLMHGWRNDFIEIQASFFFHYRGSAVQKLLEGVLRSLVTQLLKTFVDKYKEQHLATWEEYRDLKAQTRRAENHILGIQQSINRLQNEDLDKVGQASKDSIKLPKNSEKAGQERERKALLREFGRVH